MRTAVISDIHIDMNDKYDVMGELIQYLKREKIEALLIAGDISSKPELTLSFAELLEYRSGVRVLYVPGNHDMWNHRKEQCVTEDIYHSFCRDERCLCGKIEVLNRHVVIGDIAWYDYSFGNPQFTDSEFDEMTKDGRTWKDYFYNDWSRRNKEVSHYFLDRLENQLRDSIKLYPNKKIVFMTHMVSNRMFRVPEEINNWAYFNAFLGSAGLEELCIRYQVEYAICGHVHYRHSRKENGVNWMCRCLNYGTEWQGNKDVAEQIADTIEVIEL